MGAKKIYNSIINTTPNKDFEFLTYRNSISQGDIAVCRIFFNSPANLTVDWGDGTIDNFYSTTDALLQHIYSVSVLHKVVIKTSNPEKIIDITITGCDIIGNLSTAVLFYTSLQRLLMFQNHFSLIPDSILKNPSLTYLEIGSNGYFIGKIPESILQSDSIKYLGFSQNNAYGASYISRNYGRVNEMNNLESLQLTCDNYGEYVPDNVFACAKLLTLSLYYSYGVRIPTSVSGSITITSIGFYNSTMYNNTVEANLALFPNLRDLSCRSCHGLSNWDAVVGMTNLYSLDLAGCYYLNGGYTPALPANLPSGFQNCTNLKVIDLSFNQWSSSQCNSIVDDFYTLLTTYATGSGNTGNFRGMSIYTTSGLGNTSGTYQAPTGFVLGGSNGTPASQKEKIYVMVNNYGHYWSYS